MFFFQRNWSHLFLSLYTSSFSVNHASVVVLNMTFDSGLHVWVDGPTDCHAITKFSRIYGLPFFLPMVLRCARERAPRKLSYLPVRDKEALTDPGIARGGTRKSILSVCISLWTTSKKYNIVF